MPTAPNMAWVPHTRSRLVEHGVQAHIRHRRFRCTTYLKVECGDQQPRGRRGTNARNPLRLGITPARFERFQPKVASPPTIAATYRRCDSVRNALDSPVARDSIITFDERQGVRT